MGTDAQRRAVNKYLRSHYDRITLRLPRGKREMIQVAADQASESVNQYILRAVMDRMGIDDWADKEAD
ncbi:MAG TPA: Arc family DNA-binding protein [Candidatus Faecivicinus avistercoris]|nr:Arc family DNA-binding protein [Candidatus Faecivicinus avistercoris]